MMTYELLIMGKSQSPISIVLVNMTMSVRWLPLWSCFCSSVVDNCVHFVQVHCLIIQVSVPILGYMGGLK